MTQTYERTILFADLRGSTSLYESLGNAEASAVVTQSVALLARIVAQRGGMVVKTLGDGLMAMFNEPTAGVASAIEMHDALERWDGPAREPQTPQQPRLPPLKLQVALAHGEVVEMSGDVFGDAVNVAARLLDHAGDNETLATQTVIEGLSEPEQERFRSLDRMQLRGRVEPVHVHLLEPARRFGDTEATMFGEILAAPAPEGIRLVWLDLNRIYAGTSLPVVLGRSPQATYCIDDTRVSRSHARVDWHGGTFQLTDLSYNGTFVRFANDTQTVSLRRSTCTLHGSGIITLGAPVSDVTAPAVRFEVMKFSDTQPHGARDFGAV
jgi:class 3 adenylate cyclase